MNIRNILIVIDTARVGGPGKGVLQLLRHFSELGVNARVATFQSDRHESSEFVERLRDEGHEPLVLFERSRFDLGLVHQLRRYCDDENISVVQSHGYKAHLLALLATKGLKNVHWVGVLNGWTNENWKVSLYHSLDSWTLQFAAGIVAVSPELLDFALSKAPRVPRFLIENAVDTEEIKLLGISSVIRKSFCKGKRLIGVVGRLSPEKGHELLLRAFRAAKDELPKTDILMIGDGPERSNLERLASELRIAEDVHFCGYQQTIGDYFKALDLLVLPSYREGLPNVVLESMAHQVPILASDIPAVKDIVQDGETGWLFQSGDLDSLKLKLQEVLTYTPEERMRVSFAARRSLYPRFSPAERANRFKSVYDVVSRRAAITPRSMSDEVSRSAMSG